MEGFVYTIPRGLKRRAPSDKKSSGILNFRGPKQMFLDFGQVSCNIAASQAANFLTSTEEVSN